MLILRRRVGECVLIGEGVELEVLEITPTQVKFGIRAPKSVLILRKEVQLTSEQNTAASRFPAAEALARLKGLPSPGVDRGAPPPSSLP
jgi:carbon storage regulator